MTQQPEPTAGALPPDPGGSTTSGAETDLSAGVPGPSGTGTQTGAGAGADPQAPAVEPFSSAANAERAADAPGAS